MREITDAVVLMAGTGSRLRASGEMLPKPLVPMLGRPLICYIIESLQQIGVQTLHAVIGSNGDDLIAALRPFIPSTIRLNAIPNPEWQKQNGISVLRAAGKVRAPFLLMMGDHLFQTVILERMAERSDRTQLNLAVDQKIETIFDIDDAMKVQTKSDRVVAIGKQLTDYNAIDTGIFLCPNELFDYLEHAKQNGDCSLADGVRLMAADNKVKAIDIGDAWWQDVDTSEMHAHAEAHFREVRPLV